MISQPYCATLGYSGKVSRIYINYDCTGMNTTTAAPGMNISIASIESAVTTSSVSDKTTPNLEGGRNVGENRLPCIS